MVQLIVNVNLLREIDEDKLLNAYARLIYTNEEDIFNDNKIKENLIQLLDWDKNGDNGLGIYCGKFENIKERDWKILIDLIKENYLRIEKFSRPFVKEKIKEQNKVIDDVIKSKERHNKERFTSENYKVSGRGKKARPCIYEGREYKSRQECMYKEGLTKYQLWIYLKNTNQI